MDDTFFGIKSDRLIFTTGREMSVYLLDVGYDDFRKIDPIKFFRVQNGYTLHYIISGSGTLDIEDMTYRLRAGQLFFIPPGVSFRYYPEEGDLWRYVWFMVKGSGCRELFKEAGLSLSAPVGYTAESGKMEELLSCVLSRNFKNETEAHFFALSALYDALATLKRDPGSGDSGRSCNSDFYVETVRECIDMNFRNPDFTVESASGMAHISHSYMCRIFKKKTGITAVGYLKKVRLEAARELLSSTGKTVKEISEEVGFSDHVHFTKEFLRLYGITPGKYRRDSAPHGV